MGFSTIEQLIAKGAPSPISSALQGVSSGIGILGNLQNLRKQQLLNQIQQAKAQLAPQLAQAELDKARQDLIQGDFARNVSGILQLAKSRGLSPQQTGQLLDFFGLSKQKAGINLGFGPGGQLTSLQMGGSMPAGGAQGMTGALAPTAVIPNSGQTSRGGSQGANKVNIDTGNVTSIPTRTTGGFLQQGIIGAEKLKAALDDYTNGVSPYAGSMGHIKFGLDLAKAATGDDEAKQRITNYYTAKGNRIALATDAARMASGTSPSQSEIKEWINALNPGFFEKPEFFKGHMQGFRKMIDTWEERSKKGLETGIPVSQLGPAEIQTLKNQQQIAASTPTLSQIFLPDDRHTATLHALQTPQHLINGVPHLKPEQTKQLRQEQPSITQQTQPTQKAAQFSQSDLENTAKVNNMTVNDVKRVLDYKSKNPDVTTAQAKQILGIR